MSATDTGSDPNKFDTDGDGSNDGLEVIANGDPTDPNLIADLIHRFSPSQLTPDLPLENNGRRYDRLREKP